MILPRLSFPRSSYNSSIGLPAKGDGRAPTKRLAKQLWDVSLWMSSNVFHVQSTFRWRVFMLTPDRLRRCLRSLQYLHTFHYLSWKIDAFVLFGWPHSSVQATCKSMLLSETCIFHCKRIITSPQLSPIKSHTHRIRLCFVHNSYKAAICCRPNRLTHCQTTLIARQASHLDVAPKRSSSLPSHSLKRGPDGCLMSLDQFATWSGILYSFLFSSLLHGSAGSLCPPNLAGLSDVVRAFSFRDNKISVHFAIRIAKVD